VLIVLMQEEHDQCEIISVPVGKRCSGLRCPAHRNYHAAILLKVKDEWKPFQTLNPEAGSDQQLRAIWCLESRHG
jgi:hypothetical protein